MKPTLKDAEDVIEPSPLDTDELADMAERVYQALLAAYEAGQRWPRP